MVEARDPAPTMRDVERPDDVEGVIELRPDQALQGSHIPLQEPLDPPVGLPAGEVVIVTGWEIGLILLGSRLETNVALPVGPGASRLEKLSPDMVLPSRIPDSEHR